MGRLRGESRVIFQAGSSRFGDAPWETSLRYLLISDVHSNLEALEACLGWADGQYDRMLCLGDLVGYGPDPNAVIERLKPIASTIIRGNHDKACSAPGLPEDFNSQARFAVAWTQRELRPAHADFLRSLPPGPVQMEGFQIVHGSPRDEDEYIVGPGEARPLLESPATQTVCFGHTHFQGGFMLSRGGGFQAIRPPSIKDGMVLALALEPQGRYLVNPGSVGQPRDGDWRAAFAILDTRQERVEYFRASYDVAKTQEKMRKADLPKLLWVRLAHGR